MRKLVYAAAELGAFLLVCWTAGGAAQAFGYGALAQVFVGLAVGAVFALLSAAAVLKWREANDRIAGVVARELDKREQPVEALLNAVREDCPTPEEVARVRARWEAAHPPLTQPKHRLLDPEETQELFTHNYRALAQRTETMVADGEAFEYRFADPCQLPLFERPHVQSVENYMRSAPAPSSTIPDLDDELNGRKHEGGE